MSQDNMALGDPDPIPISEAQAVGEFYRSYLTLPQLDDVVQADDVSTKGGGGFKAEYVNWARISHYLRVHAPGWQPYMERNEDGLPYHYAPDASVFLLIGFRHPDPSVPDTEPVVHAVMDARNNAKGRDQVDARDISDAFVRGMCKAAALTFGLGWKLWSKDDPLGREDAPPAEQPKRTYTKRPYPKDTPQDDVGGDGVTDAQRKAIYAKTRKLGFDDERRAELLAKYEVESTKELTRAQASEILDTLTAQEKARKEA